jgi:hypothetical protein
LPPPATLANVRTFSARISTSAVGAGNPSRATVNIPPSLLDASPAADQSRLFARVTVAFKGSTHAVPLRVSIGNDGSASADAPGFAGVLAMFGHHGAHGPVTFLVPLSTPVRTLRARNALRADAPLGLKIEQIGAAEHTEAHATASDTAAEILSVAVEVH